MKYLDIGGVAHKYDEDGNLWKLSQVVDKDHPEYEKRVEFNKRREQEELAYYASERAAHEEYKQANHEYGQLSVIKKLFTTKPRDPNMPNCSWQLWELDSNRQKAARELRSFRYAYPKKDAWVWVTNDYGDFEDRPTERPTDE